MNNEQIKTLVRWAYRDGYRACERGRGLDVGKYMETVRFLSTYQPFTVNEAIDAKKDDVAQLLEELERFEKNESPSEELKAAGWGGLSGDVIGIDEGVKEETSHD